MSSTSSVIAQQKILVARIKVFVARNTRLVARIDIRDGRIDVLLRRHDADDARNEKLDAPIGAIDGFDASLTPRVSRTAAAGAIVAGLDAIAR